MHRGYIKIWSAAMSQIRAILSLETPSADTSLTLVGWTEWWNRASRPASQCRHMSSNAQMCWIRCSSCFIKKSRVLSARSNGTFSPLSPGHPSHTQLQHLSLWQEGSRHALHFSVFFYLILDVNAHRQSGNNPDALLLSSIHSLLVADFHFWYTSAV